MSREDSILDLLRGIPFLNGISENDLRRIASIAEVRDFPAGTVLFREGQPHPDIYLLVEGSVALEVRIPGQEARRLQTVGDGELLGWSPVLGESAMTATARALRPGRAIAVNAKQLSALCEHNPSFGLEFMKRTAQSLANRLSATRLQLIDIYSVELPVAPITEES